MGINVLVVDDSSTMRSMVQKVLSMSGLPIGSFFQAENGREGLDVLDKEWIDIALVDINMPIMTGMEMIDQLRDKPDLCELPIVVVSTESSESRISEIKEKGIRFVHKPFTPELMRSVVEDLLGEF